MKKILALITSPLHLIEMVNLMMYDFNGAICDVAVDDCLLNVISLVENIKKISLFNNAFVISSNSENKETGRYGKYIAKFLRNVHFSKKSIQKKLKRKYRDLHFDYDTICFYDNWYLNNLIALSQNHLDNIIWLDDGFASYAGVAFFNKNNFWDKVRSLFKVNFLRDNITKQYLFYPELKCDGKYNFKCKKLRSLNAHNQELRQLLNTIFGINKLYDIKQRYVYLDEPYDEAGGKISNIEILDLVNPYIRKENILIKMHYRNESSEYSKDYQVLNVKGIPWEVIYMNLVALNQKVILIGLYSTALATPFLIFGDKTPVLILLNFINENIFNERISKPLQFTKKIFNSFPDVFFQPRNNEELQLILKTLNQ